MKKDLFKYRIQDRFYKEGNDMYSNNSSYIIDGVNNNDAEICETVNITSIEQGRFYFMLYDLQGKTSKLEKFNPILALNWVDADNTKYLYAVSINFMPMTVRVLFFNTLFNNNLKMFSEKELLSVIKSQSPIIGFNLTRAYKMLKSIGFEWTIRKFDIRNINKAQLINNNVLDRYIMMSTYKITGVDDGKLIEIWKSKIDKQNEREREFISELIGDYEKMQNEMNNKYTDLYSREENALDALEHLRSLGI